MHRKTQKQADTKSVVKQRTGFSCPCSDVTWLWVMDRLCDVSFLLHFPYKHRNFVQAVYIDRAVCTNDIYL